MPNAINNTSWYKIIIMVAAFVLKSLELGEDMDYVRAVTSNPSSRRGGGGTFRGCFFSPVLIFRSRVYIDCIYIPTLL